MDFIRKVYYDLQQVLIILKAIFVITILLLLFF